MLTPDYELGGCHRAISTRDPQVAQWVDQGLGWLYGFNFEAAVQCFQAAIELDRTCVLAYWGVALGSGCNYNKPWRVFTAKMIARAMKQARGAVSEGLRYAELGDEVEVALLRAVEKRFQANGAHAEEVLEQWNRDYADAMRDVYIVYPNDVDVAALFADALINQTPWKLWNLDSGEPEELADTREACLVLERAMAQIDEAGGKPHPGLCHTYIHVMEMSPKPHLALRAADALRELAPDSGHLLHMPSHIDILCGDYRAAVAANNRAIASDQKYFEHHRDASEYTIYCAHNIHVKVYAAMLLGQYQTAMEGAKQMEALLTEALLRTEVPPMAALLEGMVALRLHVLIRFGRWRDVLEQPFPSDAELYCNTLAVLRYARGVAYANLKEIRKAETERQEFMAAQAQLPELRFVVNNTCRALLEVASAILDGELEYHKGNEELAFQHLRRAVQLDDHLEYMEPWGWMMPTRHPLGALLHASGHHEEAASVFRADLGIDASIARCLRHPNNVWSLRGYVSCLHALGQHEQAAHHQGALDVALARADVPIGASCLCALKPACCEQ